MAAVLLNRLNDSGIIKQTERQQFYKAGCLTAVLQSRLYGSSFTRQAVWQLFY